MNSFHAEQKVVCVNAKARPGTKWYPGEALKEGAIYTITRIFADEDGTIIVHLQEILRSEFAKKVWESPDLGYGADRFRPVKITSIAIFTAMLAPTPRVKVRA